METEKQEVATVKNELQQIAKPINMGNNGSTNVFGSKDLFEHTQRIAMMFSKSELVPPQFKGNVGNCLIALEMAGRVGASPLMIMQNLYIVHGKPAWSSTFLIATINACGRFSPLRYKENAEKTSCIAWAYDKETKEVLEGIEVTMAIAKAEGWIDKTGSKWKTMPQLMLRYRAATFFARQFAPELSMGIHTQEEVEDIGYTEVRSSGGKESINSNTLKSIFGTDEVDEEIETEKTTDDSNSTKSITESMNQESDKQKEKLTKKSKKQDVNDAPDQSVMDAINNNQAGDLFPKA